MIRLLGVLLLVLAMNGLARADATADAAALTGLLARIDSSAVWDARAQSVTSQGDDAVARTVAIARADGSLSISIEMLTVRDLDAAASGSVRFGRLSLQAVQVTGPLTTLNVPDLGFDSLTVPSFADYLPDPQKPAAAFGALLSHLAGVGFAVAAAPSLALEVRTIDVAATATPGAEASAAFTRRFTMRDLRAGPMADGRLAAFSANAIAAIDASTSGNPSGAGVDRVEIADLDLAALAAVMDPAQSAPVEQWRTMLGKFTAANIMLRAQPTAPDASPGMTRIKDLTVQGVDVRRGAKSVGEVWDAIIAIAADPKESQNDLMIFPEGLSWLRLGSLSIGEMLVSDGTGAGSFTVRQTLIEALSDEGVAKISMQGLSMLGQGLVAGLDEISVEGIRWPSVAALAAVSAVEEQRAKGSVEAEALKRAAENFLNVYPQADRFRIAGLLVSLGGTAPLTLAEVLVTQGSPQPSATISRGTLRQFVIPAALLAITPEAAGALSGLGYTQFAFDGVSEVTHDRSTGIYAGKGSLTLTEGGTIQTSYTFSGATDETMQAIAVPFLKAGESDTDMQELSAALDRVRVDDLEIEWRDNTLVRRLVTWWAQQQQIPEAALAQGLADSAAEVVKLLAPALVETARTAVNAFLLNPQTLTVSAKPPVPVGVGQLLRSATTGFPLPDIGLTIEANR